ncbi:hypothetical protein BJX64DRAFT_123891 [Aspergillus heterothallicus]
MIMQAMYHSVERRMGRKWTIVRNPRALQQSIKVLPPYCTSKIAAAIDHFQIEGPYCTIELKAVMAARFATLQVASLITLTSTGGKLLILFDVLDFKLFYNSQGFSLQPSVPFLISEPNISTWLRRSFQRASNSRYSRKQLIRGRHSVLSPKFIILHQIPLQDFRNDFPEPGFQH